MENQNNTVIQPEKANYFIRIIAFIIDIILVYTIFVSKGLMDYNSQGMTTAEQWNFIFVSSAMSILYFSIMEGTVGATVGKLIFKIKVVKNENEKLSFGMAVLRTIIKLLGFYFSIFIIGIFVFLPIYGNKRTLSDLICKTHVIKKQ